MSYRDPYDPRDPRTARYEPGYDPDTRAYGKSGSGGPQQGGYSDDYTRGYADQGYTQGYSQQGYPAQQGYSAAGGRDDAYASQAKASRPRRGPDINPGMFAGGVVMTGVVTGLAAWLVAWIIRAIVQRVNEAGKFGVWNPVAQDEIWFAVVGFLCALAAGALWYVLQLVTPSPNQFYRWIVGLLLAAAVIIPLVLSSEVSVGIGTAVMHLVIGLPVLSLIPAMGQKSLNRNR